MIRIALYYPMRIGLWKSVLRGIFRYARPAKQWVFSMAFQEDPKRLLKWKPDAVIGQIETPRAVRAFADVTMPVVDTSYSFHQLEIPRVRFDDVAIGRLAARYLIERGFEHLGCVGSSEVAFEAARCEGFDAELARVARVSQPSPVIARSRHRPDDLGPVGKSVVRWLKESPKPLGIFAAVDPLALRLSEACLANGLRVPEDVALLGVNNDELICYLASPPLSSIRLPAEQLGFEAARLLDRWLTTGDRPDSARALPAADVVTRHSTDIYAAADEVVMRALHYIRDHATSRLSVMEVVEAMDVSRSSLERRFKTVLHRSPLEEIRRVQFVHAKRLLLETNLTIPEIAAAAGFRDGKHLATSFRRTFGQTPSEFRRNR